MLTSKPHQQNDSQDNLLADRTDSIVPAKDIHLHSKPLAVNELPDNNNGPTAAPILATAQIIAIPTGTKRPHSDCLAAAEDNSTVQATTPTTQKRARPASAATTKKLFIYGNYDRYYGYRNAGKRPDCADVRLEAFRTHAELFDAADCLDIGCNCGAISFAVASQLGTRSMVGIDIDKALIGKARQQLSAEKRKHLSSGGVPNKNPEQKADQISVQQYPHNIYFKHGNYVLSDPSLLDMEQAQYDTILCLSITKWIHLNFGDAGLKLAFQRMFKQLRAGGRLVLEAQNWQSYKRRKRLTTTTERHFAEIRLQPAAFEAYLLGAEVGFTRCWRMEAPRTHEAAGFRRPILVFEKAAGLPEGAESATLLS